MNKNTLLKTKTTGPTRIVFVESLSCSPSGVSSGFSFTMPYEQKTAQNMLFIIVCNGLPMGSVISIVCPQSGPTPPLYLPPTVVSTSPSFTTGLSSLIPAGFKGDITATVVLPAGVGSLQSATVTLQVAYPVDTPAPRGEGPDLKVAGTQAGTTVTFKSNFEMGNEAARVMFMLNCTDIPIGSIVGFNCAQPGPVPLIHLDNTPVTSTPSFVAGMSSVVPANFFATIDCFVTFFTTPPPGARIEFMAAIAVDGFGS